MSGEPFTIEQTYPVSMETVWKAITQKEIMKEWYFDLAEFKPEVGFEFQFYGGQEGGVQYLHLCKVIDVVEGEKITYSWRYDGYEGISYVTFELSDAGGGSTRLHLTHAGLESFPADNPDLAKANFVTGWTELIQTSLKNFLEKNLPVDS